jgi:hypothetical protein
VPVRGRKGDLESIYNLNEVAAFIWSRIDGGTDAQGIADAVSATFDVAPDDALADVLAFAGELAAAGLVEPAPAPAHKD